MRLFLISQAQNNNYDTFDSAIVCAEDSEEAKSIHPQTSWGRNHSQYYWEQDRGSWASSPEFVKVEEIGQANINQKKGVILASYNAG
jgi:hypothetical protein